MEKKVTEAKEENRILSEDIPTCELSSTSNPAVFIDKKTGTLYHLVYSLFNNLPSLKRLNTGKVQ